MMPGPKTQSEPRLYIIEDPDLFFKAGLTVTISIRQINLKFRPDQEFQFVYLSGSEAFRREGE